MLKAEVIGAQIQTFILDHFPRARTQDFSNDILLLESGILDSLGILEIVNYLENEFDIIISDDDLIPENFQTISHIVKFIQVKLS